MMASKQQTKWLQKLVVALCIVIPISFVTHCGMALVFNPNINQFVTAAQYEDVNVSVPEYTGNPSVVLSDTSGLSAKSAPTDLVLSDLDVSGRCGTVEMIVSLETAPSRGKKRGSIGMVKPSGWHTVRDDSLDGKYLYNRCHLIAWCLSGMNAEKRNLITGTRYMNVEGMLPYETKVSDFIFAGGGRVYYRVTPDFRTGELVARGVRIQAYSLADKGKSIDFDVYCYNVQPGYKIDYATGKAAKVK